MTHLTYAQILKFADKCQGAKKPEDITLPLSDILAGQGIRSWFVGSLGAINQWNGFSFDQIPDDWRRRYIERRYHRDDPVFHHALSGGQKTTWSAARRSSINAAPHKRAEIIANEAAECGLSDGLIMAIHGFGDLPAAVSYGGHDLDLGEDAQASLFVIGAFAYEWLRRLSVNTTPIPPFLTEREMQVLRWTAQGKSATDIGVILHLSPHTVREHHVSIRKKYGVATLIQAVVYAAIDGQLSRSFEL